MAATAEWYWNWTVTACLAHPRMQVSSFNIIDVNLECCDTSSSQISCCHGRIALSKAYNSSVPKTSKHWEKVSTVPTGTKVWCSHQLSVHRCQPPLKILRATSLRFIVALFLSNTPNISNGWCTPSHASSNNRQPSHVMPGYPGEMQLVHGYLAVYKKHTPFPRATIWPWTKSYCRVLRGRCFL